MRKSNQEVLRLAETVIGYIESDELTAAQKQQIVDDSIANFTHYVNKGILQQRKSVSDNYSFVEWEDKDTWFCDTKGEQFIDCLGGYGVHLLGHRHPKVVKAVAAQLQRCALHSQELVDPLRGYLSQLVAYITPGGLQNSYLVNSGTEANEMALKLARIATGKKWFISTFNGFHGKTFGSLSVSGKPLYRDPYMPLLHAVKHVPFGDAGAAEDAVATLKADGETVAGIIVEPIQGEGGINVPPDGYLTALRELCDRHGCLLIVDEVQTGMGRTGKLFGVDHEGVVPDIMTLGKAFGGGVMPVAAVVAKAELWGCIEENPTIFGSSTFGGNPLACAAAIACIKTVLEEDIPGQAAVKGDYLLTGMKELSRKYASVLIDARGRGLLLGLEFASNELGFEFARRMFSNHILVGGTMNNAKVIRIQPPAVITRDQMDQLLATIERQLEAMAHG